MSDKPENPPAFPRPNLANNSHEPQDGMTLRDYFAGQVLPYAAEIAKEAKGPAGEFFGDSARLAYVIADAMLEAREEKS